MAKIYTLRGKQVYDDPNKGAIDVSTGELLEGPNVSRVRDPITGEIKTSVYEDSTKANQSVVPAVIPPPETPRPVAAPTPPPTFAETLATTREEQAKQTQSLINAIKESFQTRFLEAGEAQRGREARTRALGVKAGLAGSEFQTAAALETEAVGRREREAISREQTAAVQVALQQADQNVIKLAEIATREAGEEFERATEERERVLTEGKTNAQLAFTALGKQGKNFDDLSETQKESLRQSTGFSDLALKGLFISTLPDTELLSKAPVRVGSKAIFFQKDPASPSGFKKIEFDVGEDLEDVDKQFTIAPDGTPLIFNKRTGEASIAEGFKEGQFAKPETTGLTPTQLFDRELKLAQDFERNAKEARTALRQVDVVETGFNEAINALKEGKPLNAQSQAVIIGFNKMIDPTSVVRESEYARTPEGASLFNRLDGAKIRISQGGAGLNKAELEGIRNTALALLNGYKEQQLNFAKRTQKQAESIGANLERVLTPDVLDLLQQAEEPEKAKVGEELIVNGHRVKKVGEDEYELIE